MTIALGISGAFLALVAVFLWLLAVRDFRRASLLGTPLQRMSRVEPGRCKVRGQVVALEKALRSPVTEQPCVYYRLRVDQERRQWKSTGGAPAVSGAFLAGFLGGALGGLLYGLARGQAEEGEDSKVITSWVRILNEAESVRMAVEDEHGVVIEVDLEDAEVISKGRSSLTADYHQPAPAHLNSLLYKQYDIDTIDDQGKNKTMRFLEDMLPPGAKVTVIGTVEEEDDGDLCFVASEGPLLATEREVIKMGRTARKWAVGYTLAGAGSFFLAASLVAVALTM